MVGPALFFVIREPLLIILKELKRTTVHPSYRSGETSRSCLAIFR